MGQTGPGHTHTVGSPRCALRPGAAGGVRTKGTVSGVGVLSHNPPCSGATASVRPRQQQTAPAERGSADSGFSAPVPLPGRPRMHRGQRRKQPHTGSGVIPFAVLPLSKMRRCHSGQAAGTETCLPPLRLLPSRYRVPLGSRRCLPPRVRPRGHHGNPKHACQSRREWVQLPGEQKPQATFSLPEAGQDPELGDDPESLCPPRDTVSAPGAVPCVGPAAPRPGAERVSAAVSTQDEAR